MIRIKCNLAFLHDLAESLEGLHIGFYSSKSLSFRQAWWRT
jgi:hypothetical protein